MRRRLGLLLPGARERRRQIEAYAISWGSSGEDGGGSAHPWWLVLGDSTAQGIGASSFDRGYVGLVRDRLVARDGRPWRVRNLSVSGARAADVVTNQLPMLVDALASPSPPTLVSCAIGANDLLRRSDGLLASLEVIAGTLPPGALLANLPRGLREREAAAVNESIAVLVAAHELRLVDLWSVSGPPWGGKFARDLFHPSDLGYADWARAFIAAIEAGA